jgi:DnaK suppressor protein
MMSLVATGQFGSDLGHVPATKAKLCGEFGMKKVEMKAYKDRLLSLRSRLVGDVSHLAEAALKKNTLDANAPSSRMPIHMADLGTDNYEQEFTLSLMANDESTLDAIESALERIEDGVYGTCEECSGPIRKSRLNAIPYTALCIKCAEQHERR